MKKIYTLAIALMSGVILTACVGTINIGAGTTDEDKTEKTDKTIDPKSMSINGNAPEPENFQVARISFCGIHANKNHADCIVTLSRVTAASWSQSFEAPLPILSRGELSIEGSHFVQGKIDTIEDEISSDRLDLSSLGGDKADGFGYIWHRGYYAGIFSGTDLGLPLIETSGTAEWLGNFRAQGRYSTADVVSDEFFTLIVNFGEGDQSGTISASIKTSRVSSGRYSLTGSFDSDGVITGDIIFDDQGNRGVIATPGILKGLIGQEGAVGVFHNNNDKIGNISYAGGFVARPPRE